MAADRGGPGDRAKRFEEIGDLPHPDCVYVFVGKSVVVA
jgi:hypothetical protein